MDKWIKGITADTFHRIMEELGSRGEEEYFYNPMMNVYDLCLSEPVILKAYDDKVILDLGGNKSELMRNEFVTITI